MKDRIKQYENFTITLVGENKFGDVYAIYSSLLGFVFADISKQGEGRPFEFRPYGTFSLSGYALGELSALIKLISEATNEQA